MRSLVALTPMEVAMLLRACQLPADSDFDRLLPRELRRLSRQYWTPLAVVLRSAAWLEELCVRTVVDIGSGVGKFCVAGALRTDCRFIGIEQRAHLVSTARVLSRVYGVDERVVFLHQRFGHDAPPAADAYYFFNPFGENTFRRSEWLDDTVELNRTRFHRELDYVGDWLDAVPHGTYVLTYNGVGAEMPCSFAELRAARDLPCVLKLWRKDAWAS
ncbi:MAG TPA: hypothetical protein VHB79_25095 [Polyangiaceae bacterium]|nr:hypothetical protein [Polyangiaceae bacterium]